MEEPGPRPGSSPQQDKPRWRRREDILAAAPGAGVRAQRSSRVDVMDVMDAMDAASGPPLFT